MFSHLLINRLKVLLRSKAMIFWTLVFPLILATFFNLAFSNLAAQERFEAIDIAVVQNENFKNEINFKNVLDSVSQDNDSRIFNIHYVSTEDEAIELLKANDVIGYYIAHEKIDIVIKASGIGPTIMKYVVDNYYQSASIIGNIIEFNPEAFRMEIISALNEEGNYFVDKSSDRVDFTVIYFYTLIGMVCMYAGFFGGGAALESEANLSKHAARFSVSGTHKLKGLLASLLAGFIIAYIEMLILLAYLIFILSIDFGDQMLWILILTFFGTLTGISFGMLIGVSNRKSENVKMSILLSVTMACSFLAGMMVWTMKDLVEQYAPFINRINPVAIITDALYSLYYYDSLDRYFNGLVNLAIITVIMIAISYFFVRRKKYDSI